ncbi:MAG: hypothetical protein OET44_20615, partial [Gammaproteobacteria bacterium]|nr:hypothetical protein [Gammaproteobacteria bacterium]
DLDHTVESRGDGTHHVNMVSGRQERHVCISRQADWWRVELPLGAGDVFAPAEPQRTAVGLFLLRASAAIRFVRPFADKPREDTAAVLGFVAHLPLQPALAQVEHALGSLVTAVQRFEIDIESLATEAILSHAFVAIAGGASSVANPPTYEL